MSRKSIESILDIEITMQEFSGNGKLAKPHFSQNATEVLKRRYLKKDTSGNVIETPEDMLWRVAIAIGKADYLYGANDNEVKETVIRFYNLMANKDFMPNSPTLMNAGRELGQLAACFVLPIEDSMDSIFQTLKDTALIHKSGGGTGFSFSRLRPKNSVVRSTNGVASGPVSFMKVYNAATEAVKQGGTRRGANMGILRVDHPDIMEFINCKLDPNELTNFNISVAVTDDFMEKARKGEEYELINPQNGKVVGKLNARKVFNIITKNAWQCGDPGIIFIDRINENNPTPKLGEIEATNPCGEQPLLPNESCNLGSINLSNFVVDGRIDFDRLGEVVDCAVHFLDNVIDVNKFPLKKIEETVKKTRKIGLGVMGFADALIKLKIPYNSDKALEAAKTFMKFISERAREASIKLAETRGAFPEWKNSIFYPEGPRLRNAAITTIAPTGTISMISDCSSGIEPLFSLVYTKSVMDGTNLLYVNPYFEEACKQEGIYSKGLMERIEKEGTIQNIEGIPDWMKQIFVTAHDISPEWHVKIQAAFQKYTDNAVSKTCNFRHDATVEDVRKAYWLAYELGCKGITIYRDGSKDQQVLYVGKKEGERGKNASQKLHPRPRPVVTRGITRRVKTGVGNLYVTINEDEYGLCEVFTNIGKAGSQAQEESEAIGRLISLALRSGIDVRDIIKQLKGIGGPSPVWENGEVILSTPDAIAKALEWYIEEREKSFNGQNTNKKTNQSPEPTNQKLQNRHRSEKLLTTCPECGATVYHESGCLTCPSCGWSKC